jgi:nanoRNase/pAp phosphatase (c-di-AMP/oligoRNAs hydrolase)
MTLSKARELLKVLRQYREKQILIPLPGYPDPDDISSALAHQVISKQEGIESVISHIEPVSHHENKALIRELKIKTKLKRYNGSNLNFSDFCGMSLVDCPKPDKVIQDASGLKVITIVDHHECFNNKKAEFVDIHPEVGATATIYAGYLKDMELLKKIPESKMIATALMYGIISDTDNLRNAGINDRHALKFLEDFADYKILDKIASEPVPRRTKNLISLADKRKEIKGKYLISGMGVISKEDRDAIPQAADILSRIEGINMVLVYGVVEDEIDCSIRTSRLANISKFIKNMFPEVQEYGGRKGKGGFQLLLDTIYPAQKVKDEDPKDLADSYMHKCFYKQAG